MDHRPIGVFDSGVGGLTAVGEIHRLLPEESIIYFGDTARVPYGARSKETVLKYARQDMHFLRSFDLKAAVIACGTVSTTVAPVLKEENDIPVIDVVEPTCRKAVELTRSGRIGLIATATSIRSGVYEKTIRRLTPEAQVFSKACPLLVPLVENGRVEPGDVVVETVTREYLAPLQEQGVDTLILGCTHYPLLTRVIRSIMGPEVVLINSGAAAAEGLRRMLMAQDSLSPRKTPGESSYYVSDQPEDFARLGALFLQEPLLTVQQIDIEKY